MKRTGRSKRDLRESVRALLTLLVALSVTMTMPVSADVTVGDRNPRADTIEQSNVGIDTRSNGQEFDDDGPVAVDDGGRYYIGQDLVRDEGVSSDETLDLVRPDGSSSLVLADSEGIARINTYGMMAGEYSLEGENGTVIASFSLIQQQFRVFSFESNAVENGGANTNATLTVQTNRQPTVHYLTATVAGERVDSSTLQATFGGAGETVNDEILRIRGSNADTFTLDFGNVPSGEFVLTTYSPDADATASDSITVESSQEGTASPVTRAHLAPAGTVMEIPITLQNTDTATLEFGSEDVNYHVTMEVHDADGDGSVTVRWDTQLAGQTGNASAAFSAAGEDEVTDVERSTSQFSGPIAQESYSLSLSVDETETGLGLATVTEPTNQLCGRSVDSLVETYDNNVDDLPGLVSGFVKDETVSLLVNNDTQKDYTAITGSDRRISGFRQGEPDSPTLEVETDCETVTTIVDAQNTSDAFAREYDNGEIAVRGTSLPKKIALGVGKLLVAVGQFLGVF